MINMADVHVIIMNSLRIGLKTKIVLGPQSGSIDVNKILENPTLLRDIGVLVAPLVRLGAANRIKATNLAK